MHFLADHKGEKVGRWLAKSEAMFLILDPFILLLTLYSKVKVR